jgi:hypothetical protein
VVPVHEKGGEAGVRNAGHRGTCSVGIGEEST